MIYTNGGLFFSHKKKPKVGACWLLVQLLNDASWIRFFFCFQDLHPQKTGFLAPWLSPMIVRWLPQHRHHVFKQTSPRQERKDKENQNIFLMMLFLSWERDFPVPVTGQKWIPGPILNQFLAKGNGFIGSRDWRKGLPSWYHGISALVQERSSVPRTGAEACWVGSRKSPSQLSMWTAPSFEKRNS